MTVWSMNLIGTGGFHSSRWKHFPCIHLSAGSARILFDCGEGSFAALRTLEAPGVIKLVLLSGISAEEILGLVSLVDGTGSSVRASGVEIVGPVGTASTVDSLMKLKRGKTRVYLARDACGGDVVFDDGNLTISAFELKRGPSDPGLGYVVQERSLPGRVNMDAANRLQLSGPEIGRLTRGERVRDIDPQDVLGPSRPGRRVVFAGRTRPMKELEDSLLEADVAVLAAAYIDERWDVAVASGTMTGWEAATTATSSNVNTLVLYNVSSSNLESVVRLEAEQFHSRVLVPIDGDRIEIYQRDTGATPALVRRPPKSLQRKSPRQTKSSRGKSA